jgi:hypothetical protein
METKTKTGRAEKLAPLVLAALPAVLVAAAVVLPDLELVVSPELDAAVVVAAAAALELLLLLLVVPAVTISVIPLETVACETQLEVEGRE